VRISERLGSKETRFSINRNVQYCSVSLDLCEPKREKIDDNGEDVVEDEIGGICLNNSNVIEAVKAGHLEEGIWRSA